MDVKIAMIILYTVTGIITVLFLGVIITGTVRAHLNPDRYGPRQDSNGQRQSRARGIARAVVETLPIIKFGDQEDKQLPKSDVEMASNDGGDRDNSTEEPPSARNDRQMEGVNASSAATSTIPSTTTTTPTTTTAAATATATTKAPSNEAENKKDEIQQKQQPGPAVAENAPGPSNTSIGPSTPTGTGESAATNPDVSDAGTLVCPICTDEFVKGQDVRLLPCKHKFHPECVDPWLVNVSGTCPLW